MSHLPYKRADRVAELLKEEISRIIFEDLKDPRVRMVTITRVRLTDDLRRARVYFNALGTEEDHQRCLEGLGSARAFIRSQIRNNTRLRYTPQLEFYYDDSLDYHERIEVLLSELNRTGAEE